MGFSPTEENPSLNISLLKLKDKMNKVIDQMSDPFCLNNTRIKNITRTRDRSLLLLLNVKEAADWLKEPDVEDKFIGKFANRACFRDRSYQVVLRWVPIILNPTNREHLREIKEVNSFQSHMIQSMRWIKPTTKRCARQTQAHAILTIHSADDANCAIKDGLEICKVQTRVERSKCEPLQCLKCRKWEHKAQACEALEDTCGTCGENHCTGDCTNKTSLYCVSYKSNMHTSWDRSCLEFLR